MQRTEVRFARFLCRRFGVTWRALRADRRGGVAIITALAAVVLIGFAGLAIDVASWQVTKRQMQGAADQAAIGAVVAYLAGGGDDREVRFHQRPERGRGLGQPSDPLANRL